MNLRRVRRHHPQVVRHFVADRDRLGQRVLENLDHVLNEMFGLEGDALALDAARERKHLAHHVGPALGVCAQDFQPLLYALVRDFQLEHLHGHQDRREHVVEVVRDAAGERADTLHALRAEKLRLHFFALGDVGIDDENGLRLFAVVAHERPATLNRDLRSRLRPLAHLAAPLALLADGPLPLLELRFVQLAQQTQLARRPPRRLLRRPAVDALRALVPVENLFVEAADDYRVPRLVEERGLFAYALLGALALGDVVADGDVLVGLAAGVKERDDGRVHPVDRAVLGAVANLAAPDAARGNRRPKISDELLRVVGRVDEAVILSDQLLARVLRDFAELVVDVVDRAALIRDGDDGRLVERELQVGQFLQRAAQRLLGAVIADGLPRVDVQNAFTHLRQL